VSFHSLEDRIVKRFLAVRAGRAGRVSRHEPPAAAPPPATFQLIDTPLQPGGAEVDANPRARSARLRAAIRTGAPVSALSDTGSHRGHA
jgi:16S rRNA (cytosine1402-N4)-methyltransferase